MDLSELLQTLKDVHQRLVALAELEKQHYQVVQEGRKAYAQSWLEAKANIKTASETRYIVSTEGKHFAQIVKENSSAVSDTGVEWILRSQQLAKERAEVLNGIIEEVGHMLVETVSDDNKVQP